MSSVGQSPRSSHVLSFFSRSSQISHFGHLPLILKSPLKSTQHHLYPLLNFAIFFLNLSFRHTLLSIFGNAHWILKTAPQTSSPMVNTIPLCFYDFSLFYRFLLFSIATNSIFGNAQCTPKALPNIITNSGHHPLFFLVKVPLFYCYFSFAKAHISIFESAHWTLKIVPIVVTSSEHHC